MFGLGPEAEVMITGQMGTEHGQDVEAVSHVNEDFLSSRVPFPFPRAISPRTPSLLKLLSRARC